VVTTHTVISVAATDPAEGTSLLSALSQTIALPTPSAATALKSLTSLHFPAKTTNGPTVQTVTNGAQSKHAGWWMVLGSASVIIWLGVGGMRV
jgi:hypothetical protein